MTSLINKGTYGRIFYPGIDICSYEKQDTSDSERYITKIQKIDDSEDEIKIGKIIQTIPYYTQFFSPVESACIVNTKSINYKLIKSNAIMQNDFGEFVREIAYSSSKIRYVGKYTIDQYIKVIQDEKSKKIYNTHLYLLTSLEKLSEKDIIHFDLKPTNIMYDDIQSIPIIIDFGISNVITPLLENPSKTEGKEFFIDYNTYDYWCIDVYMMSNIAYEKMFYINSKITKQHLDTLLYNFKTSLHKYIITEAEIRAFERDYHNYFSKYVDKKTWQDLFIDLLQYNKTWDNYSLSMCYLHICKDIDKDPKLNEYITLLKQNVLAMPNKRLSIADFRTKLMDIITIH
jgi:serine/threonine protein kinase